MTRLIALLSVTTAVAACASKSPTPAAPTAGSLAAASPGASSSEASSHDASSHDASSHDAPSHEASSHHGPTPEPASTPTGQPEPAAPSAHAEASATPDPKAALLAAETAAWETARPVLMAHCAVCHTRDGKKAAKKKLAHFALDTYPLGGHHTRTIGFTIREVLGITGSKPTMPYDKPGAVQGDELAAVKAWTEAWEAAEKAGAHASASTSEHG